MTLSARPFTACFALALAWLSLVPLARAQIHSGWRMRTIATGADTFRLDTLSLVPGSFRLSANDGTPITDGFEIDEVRAFLIWRKPPPADTLTAWYRVLNIDFGMRYQRRSKALIQPEERYRVNPYTYRPQTQETSLFGSTELSKTGSISRGVGFGNNQNLAVNSTLSLQMSGKINDRISILASITDDNIPIQPDGTTAQLQEFDQVYIQLYDDKSKLTAGDFFVQRPVGYFTTFFKRAQGAAFSTRQKLGTGSAELFSESSVSLSRGKFARQIVQGREGNQGPYRLRGAQGEFFIIVLAGTERVFIDGKEMQRGQENDYIIDYNTAEVTFTARQLITKDKRIAVEFQYTDANYSRSMVHTATGVQGERYKVYFNFFSEQDARNQPLQQSLTDSDRLILSLAGNDPDQAIAPSFQQVPEFNNTQILYNLVDTLGFDSVFVRATGPGLPLFQVAFSEVGQGNGDYVQDGFEATGRVFRWVAPDTLQGTLLRRGTHAPVRRLVAPRKNQLLMVGGVYKLGSHTTAEAEVGFSNTDENTFSEIGNEANVSHGVMVRINHEQPLSSKPQPLSLTAGAMLEAIGNNFQPIEPYRSVEFNRDWNLSSELLFARQEILTGTVGLRKARDLDLQYAINTFAAGGGDYRGVKHVLNGDARFSGFYIWFRGSALVTQGDQRSRFNRHRARVEKSLKWLKLGFEDEREDNLTFLGATDSLGARSYRFYDWQVYAASLDTARIGYKIFYRERTDFGTLLSELGESTHATHYGAEFALVRNPNSQLRATLSNRVLGITNPELTNEAPERTLLSRIDYNLRLARNAISSATYYELGSGLERRLEFIYLFDPTGQGPFTWIDYNGNGVKELNEFELARPEDGQRYVRIFTPTDTYERAYSNQFSQTINLQPSNVWLNKTGIRKTLARFSNQTAFRIQRRTRREDGADRYNPFANSQSDTILISQTSSLRNTFFFNRTSSKYGADYTYSDVFNKNPLTAGFESRAVRSHVWRVRYNVTSSWALLTEYETGRRFSASDFIEGRDFDIDLRSVKQSVSYQPGTNFRASLTANVASKENTRELGGEEAMLLNLGLDGRLNKLESGTFFANLNYIRISYNGATNNSLAYEMLEGLQPGNNLTWGAGVQRTLGNNLQLNLSYNGRKSEAIKAVHTGNVQVRAFF